MLALPIDIKSPCSFSRRLAVHCLEVKVESFSPAFRYFSKLTLESI
ncbi:hypothetical protein DGI_1234 [Megalodesulfovibrio gigas DSM 1382 = ATCC 19364]|uniref:Uncharacterized protein n=1 Tax=Megalodesulfovibrio gigas (strain ATCC 19364 / DSM 1382 / NCIMB 9332 / VKM B-1759) TaxID=1121448 RepID=T2GAA4_MEGG1|nr:hypothetical protein DGI_1234 [Megalodesulfovibrio gigas DSM 1382 = ATCC 19364]